MGGRIYSIGKAAERLELILSQGDSKGAVRDRETDGENGGDAALADPGSAEATEGVHS
jgi:hypothetical protein